jgi:DNA-binding MarR family transcriptional regulator
MRADPASLRMATLSALMRVSVLMADDIEAGLAKRGLTRARATALWEIARSPPLTQRDLAERLQVTPRNVTGLVDGLERTGFVRRTSHPSDRRAITLALTRKGRAAAARMQAEAAAFAAQIFDGLPDAAVSAFGATLERVRARLSEADDPRA